MRKGMSRWLKLSVPLLFAVVVSTASTATASPITWTLHDVVFDDGGAASGTFVTDSGTGNLMSYDILTTDGALRSGFHYDGVGDSKFADNYFIANSFVITNNSPFAFPLLILTFANPLTSYGSANPLVPDGRRGCLRQLRNQ